MSESDAPARAPMVLLVEDDPDVMAVLESYFEGEGFRVTTATDGWQAVVQAEGMKVDVVVCDIMMPGPKGSGIDAYAGIRQSHSLRRDVPIVFVTAMPLDKVRAALPADPRVRLLAKPVDFGALRAAVREIAGR